MHTGMAASMFRPETKALPQLHWDHYNPQRVNALMTVKENVSSSKVIIILILKLISQKRGEFTKVQAVTLRLRERETDFTVNKTT